MAGDYYQGKYCYSRGQWHNPVVTFDDSAFDSSPLSVTGEGITGVWVSEGKTVSVAMEFETPQALKGKRKKTNKQLARLRNGRGKRDVLYR